MGIHTVPLLAGRVGAIVFNSILVNTINGVARFLLQTAEKVPGLVPLLTPEIIIGLFK